MQKSIVAFLFLALVLTSCGSSKDIAYLQDLGSSQELIDNTYTNIIKPGDILSIIVSSSKPELAMPYNLYSVRPQMSITTSASAGSGISSYGSGTRQELEGYTVDTEGDIDFPVLGRLHIAGLTREELAAKLKGMLVDVMPNPIVTINFVNFKITVIGEVNRPGTYNVTLDRITIFDALGMAGDLTAYGRRVNVLVVRTNGDVRETGRINLKSKDIFESKYFYLQQNDVVYVEPMNTKAHSTSSFMTSFPVFVSLGSLATSIAMVIFYFTNMNRTN